MLRAFLDGDKIAPGGREMQKTMILTWLALALSAPIFAQGRKSLHITHQYTNINAQSLIGLPMGSHKTIVDKLGNLHWSEWSLVRRGLDVPFGFSAQLDGALQLVPYCPSGCNEPNVMPQQELYRGRFPFVVTHYGRGGLTAEELAFAARSGRLGMDIVRLRFVNRGDHAAKVGVAMSGKRDNLPGFVRGSMLVTQDGHLVALLCSKGGSFSVEDHGLLLVYGASVPAHAAVTLGVLRPYDFMARNEASLAGISIGRLLSGAVDSWQTIWGRGMEIELPEKEIGDFFYSSLAYVLILTERGPGGDLWTLDGPAGYRQYWGRGEYFQARAMEVSGHIHTAGETVEHALRVEKANGEWDWPAISGWPSWDNIGGEAGAVWDYYRFDRNKEWLAQAYPHLLAAARWIHYHREETELPPDIPAGATPIRRQIPWSCRKEPPPPLAPGGKPYGWGLLPWGYGDSGLPEGHAFALNVMALYAVECARKAALVLGHAKGATWLAGEYADYKKAILTGIQRAVKLEKHGPPYLPAMPTDPGAAISQSFVAVYPTHLLSPRNPLVTGLLRRMERSELQGLPTNMAWMGPSGVWPGESMNLAETYLRRGDVAKTAALLVAALNHSYTTDVWKEEIRVDKNLPTACVSSGHKRLENQMGTGDMPEAWANANLVNLVRDMLVRRERNTLYLLSGIPADWIVVGQSIRVTNAPTTFSGGLVSFQLRYPGPGRMVLDLTPPGRSLPVKVRFPIAKGQAIESARVNGRAVTTIRGSTVTLTAVHGPTTLRIRFR
jgi:hypothetical protein